jgi:hypothetical protein
MTRFPNDNAPFHLSSDAEFIIREILEQMAPSAPDHFDRIAAECDKGAGTFEGGPALAREVAAELRRRAKVMRDAIG